MVLKLHDLFWILHDTYGGLEIIKNNHLQQI